MSRGICSAVAAVSLMLVGTPSATAATTLGQTFVPATINTCLGEFEVLQTGRASGTSYAAPASGVITAWSFEAGAQQTVLTMRVFRPTGPDRYAVIADASELKTIPASSGLHTFSTQISVQAGDLIGIHGTSGRCATQTGNASDSYAFRMATLPVGGEGVYSTSAGFIFDISARLEPDADCDGFGDETQDPAVDPAGCSPSQPQKTNRTLTLDANKNKVKKGKKLTLSGRLAAAARQGPCESGQPVELQRKKPSQASFATYEQLQTDAQGSFSLKQKVKKSFEYRAQVVETAACTAALSNNEKVKVKKKRKR